VQIQVESDDTWRKLVVRVERDPASGCVTVMPRCAVASTPSQVTAGVLASLGVNQCMLQRAGSPPPRPPSIARPSQIGRSRFANSASSNLRPKARLERRWNRPSTGLGGSSKYRVMSGDGFVQLACLVACRWLAAKWRLGNMHDCRPG